jgi:alpha-glucosidase
MSNAHHWWQTGVIYQIYPRSFQDSNADGIGDLPGILRHLDYLSDTLGVDTVWLSPIFPSPMHDFGYDVADYCGIHPLFGDMDAFDRLLAETHQRGLKLLLDLVPNHTSDQHSLVSRKPLQPRQPQTRLVHLARPRARWGTAQQLAQLLRRPGLDF